MSVEEEIYNDIQTNGIIGPHTKMIGPVADGGRVIFVTAPGCWGPMITPNIRGGHEVNVPVAVEDASVGDALVLRVMSIEVLSKATSSGVDKTRAGSYVGDPYVMKKCPSCNEPWPEFYIDEIGENSVKCRKCGSPAAPFIMVNGYTIVFDLSLGVGITVNKRVAEDLAKNAGEWILLPKNSKQVPVLVLGRSDIVGLATRMQPFLGQLGSVPAVNIPDSHNAGDFGWFLVNASHPYAITKDDYETKLTDGHLDVDSVREGSTLIVPVKVEGGGVYAGDVHAMQGDGEVAGHTTDVTAKSIVEVSLIKNLYLEGPILLPPEEDLPPLARPWRKDEWENVSSLARRMKIEVEPVAPVQIIGSGPTLNDAVARGLVRASKLFGMSVEEIKNRVTISGAVEIGRLPGVVQITLQTPLRVLERLRLDRIATSQYKLPY